MEDNNMKRGLKSRHISMIAIGGAIGTGLFVATGSVVSQAGPGGAILAYLLIGIMLYFILYLVRLVHMLPVSLIRLSVLQWDGCITFYGL